MSRRVRHGTAFLVGIAKQPLSLNGINHRHDGPYQHLKASPIPFPRIQEARYSSHFAHLCARRRSASRPPTVASGRSSTGLSLLCTTILKRSPEVAATATQLAPDRRVERDSSRLLDDSKTGSATKRGIRSCCCWLGGDAISASQDRACWLSGKKN